MNYYLGVFKKYADFNGRARRSEFWYFFLFDSIALFVMLLIDNVLKSSFMFSIYVLARGIPYLAVSVRRMHDNNKSGWYCLIPLYNIILALSEGTRGPNEYGPDPKDPNSTVMMGESGLLDDAI